jgi:hypothetical protein
LQIGLRQDEVCSLQPPMTDQETLDRFSTISSEVVMQHSRGALRLRRTREKLVEPLAAAIESLRRAVEKREESPDDMANPAYALLPEIAQATAIIESFSRIEERLANIERKALNIDSAPVVVEKDPAVEAEWEAQRKGMYDALARFAVAAPLLPPPKVIEGTVNGDE